MKFRDKLAGFMYGRYGADELYKFLTVLFYILFFINIFVRSTVLSFFTLAVFIYSFYRAFSKNIYRRRAENEKYLKIKKSFTGFFTLMKNKWRDRKTHVYKKCPSCKAVLRLPRKKGEHGVRCPSCGKSFDVKI